ncbi:hypothetical protein CYLTODRAFT_414589 [Cylindrobasidium torrendii FP15055 ss-10]|uniref:F-box domain-containing protein n=1 Tax=Cylindrobasidium torrendii FP15055 ss-10 TaxID=1314674 RepID=A0A0D7AWL9_9AGAR|nr:hypothetical protein CYLTODRAFT_414589 [Cylindrobasidium torrendii FP15055 ss-10]
MASVFDNIPLELQRLVFFCTCCDSWASGQVGYTAFRTSGYFPVPVQHTLLQVSSGWHSIVVSTPELWCVLNLYWRSTADTANMVYFARRAIRYSGTAPLDINLMARGWHELAQDLLPESYRWRSIKFGKDHPTHTDLRAMKDNIPLLESMKLRITDVDVHATYIDALSTAMSGAVALQELDCSLNLLAAHFPWKQLQHFHIPHIYYDRYSTESALTQLVEIVSLPSLRKLTLVEVREQPLTDTVRNPAVQELEAIVCDIYVKDGWLQQLDLPSLQRAKIAGDYLPAFERLLCRSACKLVSLWVHDMHTDVLHGDSALDNLLLSLPHLEFLRIDICADGQGNPDNVDGSLPMLSQLFACADTVPQLVELVVFMNRIEQASPVGLFRNVLGTAKRVLSARRPQFKRILFDVEANFVTGALDEKAIQRIMETENVTEMKQAQGVAADLVVHKWSLLGDKMLDYVFRL